MITLKFREKYGDRIVSGPTAEACCAYILRERINDQYDDGQSVWYLDETYKAVDALKAGKAYQFMCWRNGLEYEGFNQERIEFVNEGGVLIEEK